MRSRIEFFFSFLLLCSFTWCTAQKPWEQVVAELNPLLYDNPDKAILEAQKAINTETLSENKMRYYLFLSKAYHAKRNSDESMKALMKAQELVKSSNDPLSRIDVLLNIAIQYQQMELYNNSLEVLDQTEELCIELPSDDEREKNARLGKAYAVRGMIYKSQDNNEIALRKFVDASNFLKKSVQTAPIINNQSIVYYNIGYCYINLKNYKKAEEFFIKSLEFANKSDAESLQSFALKGLGESYTIADQPEKAIKTLMEAEKKSQKIGDPILSVGIYQLLSKNYLQLGKFDEYQQANLKYRQATNEKENLELKSIDSFIENLNREYSSELKKIEQRNRYISFSIICVTLVLLGFLLYKLHKQNQINQRHKKLIQKLISK